MTPRRQFLQRASLAVAAGAVAHGTSLDAASAKRPTAADQSSDTFVLGSAGYTFLKFAIGPTLDMLRQLDVHYLCIKDFHLPLTSSEESIAAFHDRCRQAGVTGYGVGPIYMGSEAEVDAAFDYARRVGVKTLVGVPFERVGDQRVASSNLLKRIDRLVRERDLRFAIHNHGPDMPQLFPSAEATMELIRDLDPRVGLCLDIGHELRDGKDPIRSVTQYADRIHDIHLKNVTAPNQQGRAIELPRGVIDLVSFVRALRKTGYRGVCALEYEKDMENPLAGIAESVGYFRGITDATR